MHDPRTDRCRPPITGRVRPTGLSTGVAIQLIHQGLCAEEIARRWDVTREEMDQFALESHRRAC